MTTLERVVALCVVVVALAMFILGMSGREK